MVYIYIYVCVCVVCKLRHLYLLGYTTDLLLSGSGYCNVTMFYNHEVFFNLYYTYIDTIKVSVHQLQSASDSLPGEYILLQPNTSDLPVKRPLICVPHGGYVLPLIFSRFISAFSSSFLYLFYSSYRDTSSLYCFLFSFTLVVY